MSLLVADIGTIDAWILIPECPTSPYKTYLFGDGTSCIYMDDFDVYGNDVDAYCQHYFGGDAWFLRVRSAEEDAEFRAIIQRFVLYRYLFNLFLKKWFVKLKTLIECSCVALTSCRKEHCDWEINAEVFSHQSILNPHFSHHIRKCSNSCM